jgi:sec-independent protein translocase protein TatB
LGSRIQVKYFVPSCAGLPAIEVFMLNFGMWEIMVVMTLALVVVGPERLPTMVRFLGRQYGKLMRASQELRRAFLLEADRSDAEQRTQELRKRREAAQKRLDEMRKKENSELGPDGPVSIGDGSYVPFDHLPNTDDQLCDEPASTEEDTAGENHESASTQAEK